MDEFVDIVDDECGWMGRKMWKEKKVGISSLSKKLMIRQSRADLRASGNSVVFDVLELSILFSQFIGLNFVRGEHQKFRKKEKTINTPDF